jgi:hypothetical protein
MRVLNVIVELEPKVHRRNEDGIKPIYDLIAKELHRLLSLVPQLWYGGVEIRV